MIPTIVIAVVALLGLAYVIRPLFTTASLDSRAVTDDAEIRKRRALDAILDLEADLAAGKIDPDDYRAFREVHERDAMAALRELDVATQAAGDDFEAEIAAARAELR